MGIGGMLVMGGDGVGTVVGDVGGGGGVFLVSAVEGAQRFSLGGPAGSGFWR